MKNKILESILIGFMFIFTFLIICHIVSAGDPFRVVNNMQLHLNDIYNATNVNASYFWQGGLAVLDTSSSINSSNINQSKLNVNSSDYWDSLDTPADFTTITASGLITAGEFTGTLNGSNVDNMDLSCGADTYFTGLNFTNESGTCTGISDVYLSNTGDNASAYEYNFSKVSVTNIEADNLESNLDGTGFNITVYGITATDSWITNLFTTVLNSLSTMIQVNKPLNMSTGKNITYLENINPEGTKLNIGGDVNVSGTFRAATYDNLPSLDNSSLWANGSSAIYVTDSTKDVGMGTATPTEKLDVEGNITTSGNWIISNVSATTLLATFLSGFTTLGNIIINGYNITGGLVVDGDTNITGNVVIEGNLSGGSPLNIRGGIEVVNGNVTIKDELEVVKGLHNSGSPLKMKDSINLTTGILYLTEDYSLGVAGSTILRRKSNSGAIFGVSNPDSGNLSEARYILISNTSQAGFDMHSLNHVIYPGKAHLWVNGTASGFAFQLNGTVPGSYEFYDDDDDILLFMNGTTGNIGVNMSDPLEKLHINGNINVTGNVYAGGCIQYNCTQSGGCITLGVCT